MRILPIAALALLLSQCAPKSGNTETEQTDTTQSDKPAFVTDPGKQCYAWSKDEDIIGLTLNVNGNEVTGLLAYVFTEKDRSAGSITGKMHGDTLFAEYKFAAEGKMSTREVAFLKRGDAMIEGHGDVEEREKKMMFKDKTKLQFTDAVVLKAVPCSKTQTLQ